MHFNYLMQKLYFLDQIKEKQNLKYVIFLKFAFNWTSFFDFFKISSKKLPKFMVSFLIEKDQISLFELILQCDIFYSYYS